METKPQILLLTHGGWGMSLVQGVRMILGSVDFVKETALLPEMTLPEYMSLVKAEVENLPEGSMIMTDVFGGTTTNVAAKLGKEYGIKVYSGLNAPMLLAACSDISLRNYRQTSAPAYWPARHMLPDPPTCPGHPASHPAHSDNLRDNLH